MKNLITSVACIMILLVFVLQFTQNQILYNRIIMIDQVVENFKDIVKQEGCITASNEKRLREEMMKILPCAEREIQIKGDKEPVLRGEMIHYEVQIPIQHVIGGADFWGITEEENLWNYKISRYTTSEYIGT